MDKEMNIILKKESEHHYRLTLKGDEYILSPKDIDLLMSQILSNYPKVANNPA